MAGGFGNSHVPLSLPGGATPVVPVQSNFFPRSQVETCEASKVIMQEIGWLKWLKAVPRHSLLMSETLSNKKHHQDYLSFHGSLQQRLNTWCWWTCPRPSRRRTALSTSGAKSLHPQNKSLAAERPKDSTNIKKHQQTIVETCRTPRKFGAPVQRSGQLPSGQHGTSLSSSQLPDVPVTLVNFRTAASGHLGHPDHLDSNLVCTLIVT